MTIPDNKPMTPEDKPTTPRDDLLVRNAKNIIDLLNNANDYAKISIEQYIKAGVLLLKSRKQFPGDNEFGKWRKKEIPQISRNWAYKLMSVAQRFPNERPALPISTLAELSKAEDDVIEVVEKKLLEGEKISLKDVKDMKKGTKDDTKNTPETDTKKMPPSPYDCRSSLTPVNLEDIKNISENNTKTVREPIQWSNSVSPEKPEEITETYEERLYKTLSLPILQRMKQSDDSWVIFGLSPLFDGFPHPEVIRILYDHHKSQLDQRDIGTLDKAFKDIASQYSEESNFNEELT